MAFIGNFPAANQINDVMPGLVPGIHVLLSRSRPSKDVDGWDKPGHDD
jgi:hypothetical protein